MAPSKEETDAPSSSSSLRIKGYLPVRLRFPSSSNNSSNNDDNNQHDDETFFFVKEHHPHGKSSSGSSSTDTLFVANCPVHPRVSSKLLLQSCLGRYGDVRRVTVIAHPRGRSGKSHNKSTTATTTTTHHDLRGETAAATAVEEQDAETVLGAWTTKFSAPSFLPKSVSSAAQHQRQQPELLESGGGAAVDDNGKFAHVVFASAKEMKRTMRTLTEIMAGSDDIDDDDDEEEDDHLLPAIKIDTVELQTLADGELNELEEDSDSNDGTTHRTSSSGVRAVAARYRASCRPFLNNNNSAAAALLEEECNDVVQAFEDAEEEERRRRQAAAAQPDDDGFVTVTYSGTVATAHKRALEDDATTATAKARSGDTAGARGGRRKKTSRSRTKKKNKLGGADPLPDFYRFQTKESRKRSLQELRQRFEEDLAKVKRLKEERQYQPFS